MKMMLLSSVVAVSIATAAVMFFLAYSESDAEEPWLVTGLSMTAATPERLTLEVEYTAPEGRTGHWKANASSTQSSPQMECWRTARIGAAIPDCLRAIWPQQQ